MTLKKNTYCAFLVPIVGSEEWSIIPGQLMELRDDGRAYFWDSEKGEPYPTPLALRNLKPVVLSVDAARVDTVYRDSVHDTYTYIRTEKQLTALQNATA